MDGTANIDALFRRAFIERDRDALMELETQAVRLPEPYARRAQTRVYLARAMHRVMEQDFHGALALVDEGLMQVDLVDREGHLRLLNFSGCLLLDTGQSIAALHPTLLAARMAKGTKGIQWRQATVNVAFALLEAGDLAGAEHHVSELMNLGDGSDSNHLRWILHEVAVARGDLARANALAQESVRVLDESSHVRDVAVAKLLEASEANRTGDFARALASVEVAEESFASSQLADEAPAMAVLRATALAGQGEHKAALQVVEDMLEMPGVRSRFKAELTTTAARIWVAMGNPVEACRWYEVSTQHYQAVRNDRAQGLRSLVIRLLASEAEARLELMTANQSLERALANLRGIRQELEKRVASRTQRLRYTIEQLEGEVKQRRQAEEAAMAASAAKSTFLATMSHELRTPLGAIRGLAEILMEEHEHEPATIDDLQRILSATQHLLGVIDGILNVAQVEAGKLKVHTEALEVNALLDEVASFTRPMAEVKGLRLEVQGVSKPVWVFADPQRVRQVLLNLIGNAIKFTERGFVSVRVIVSPDTVHIAVRDTGPGILEEDRKRIFQPFEQADNSRTRRHDGTGLGLAIARRLMQAMGGSLALAPGGPGATFVAKLPLRGPEMVPPPAS